MRYLCLLLAFGLTVPAVAQETAPAIHRPVLSPDGESIVYMAQIEGDWELILAKSDGSDRKRLTVHAGWDGYANWSPDGKKLIFDRETSGKTGKQPFVLRTDDQDALIFREYQGWVSPSKWMLDGSMIGFHEREEGGQRELVRIDGVTGELTYLTNTPDSSEADADTSPDEGTVYYIESINNKTALSSLDLATGERSRLYQANDRAYGTAVSPSGNQIAFVDVAPGEENADIFVYELSDGRAWRLTFDQGWDHMPVWTRDGKSIIFTSYRTGTERPYIIALDGRQTFPLGLR